MKAGNYTVKRIKDCMRDGILLSAVSLSGVAMMYTIKSKGLLGLVLLMLAALWIIHFIKYYRHIYLPNRGLEKLVEDYKNSEDFESCEALSETEDLIRTIQQMLSSLDTIAIKEKNAEILMKNAEINNLQDQINPHFLYNTLEVIRGEALINKDRKVAEMTASLANHFRYNISRKESFVYLKDELKNSMNYFNIQKNRFGEKVSCEILYHDIQAEEVESCYVPKLILQPIIENAIYHGLELKMGQGTIRIHITVADSNLKITVADDGSGMSGEQLDAINSDYDQKRENNRHNGVAVRNIKKRLKLYWGDDAYMFAASEKGIGTQISLSMPLVYQKEEYMNQ